MRVALIRVVLLFLCMVLPACYACAESIIIRPVKTDYGVKVYLDNLKSDFNITYEDSLLTLSFQDEMEYEDLGTLSKATELVRNIVPQHKALNIFFKNKDVTIDKFTEGSAVGFNIHDPDLKEKLKVEEAKKNLVHDVKVTFEQNADVLRIKFNWDSNIATAAYIRDERLWVVFDARAKLEIQKFQNVSNPVQLSLSPDATFFVMDLDQEPKAFANILLYKQDNNWIVELSNKSTKPHDIKVVSKPYAAPVPRVELEFNAEAQEPIKFNDPYVGDDVTALATTSSSFAVNQDYNFVDFKIHKSIQGAFVETYSDDTQVIPKDRFIYINGSNPIAPKVSRKTTSKVDELEPSLENQDRNLRSILSFKKYEVTDRTFFQKDLEMWESMRNAESEDKRYLAYANIAQFYLANGFNREAGIAMKMLKQEDEASTNTYLIKLIMTAIAFEEHDYAKAHEIARAIDVTDVPVGQRKEVRFWQTITSYMLNDVEAFVTQIDPMSLYINEASSFISEYTDSFKIDFGLAIAAYKIKKKDFTSAKTIIDRLAKADLDSSNKNQLAIVSANYYAAKSEKTKALEQWDLCMGDLRDQMHRAHCMFNKAKFLYKADEISKKEYAKQLEDVVLIWRGDELEVEALKELGEVYYQLKDYINAMRSWKKIMDYFSYSPDALGLSRKVGETFVNFFTKGMDKDVSHMQAASIFYEFENLIPIGDVGDKVVMRFAEHLIALDLLDRAGALIKHQVLHRLKGYKREIAINLLAQIYILDEHPELAIEIIDSGDLIDELPDEIGLPRKYLLATAYFENEEDARALELLEGDLSKEADEIKANVYWREKNWREFNKFVEPRIYRIRDDKDMLSIPDAINVLKLTISYLIQDERKLAVKLLKDFKDRMPKDNINTEFMKILGDTYNLINDNSVSALKNLSAVEAQVEKLIEFLKNPIEKQSK